MNPQNTNIFEGSQGQYEKLEVVGDNEKYFLYRGKRVVDGKQVAIKEYKTDKDSGVPPAFMFEIVISKKNKGFFVSFVDQSISLTKQCFIVFEWKDMNLRKLIASGYEYCHRKVFYNLLLMVDRVHQHYKFIRNLRPSSVAIEFDENEQPHLELLDVSQSGQISFNEEKEEKFYFSGIGELNYSAPEILIGSTYYNKMVDIWSLGCIFYELIMKRKLFTEASPEEQLLMIEGDEKWMEVRAELQEIGLKKQWELLMHFLEKDPAQRIKMQDALQHKYFLE